MKILLDTNILLDILLEREPWREPALILWRALEEQRLVCFVTASSLTDVYYLTNAHARRYGIPDLDGRQIIRRCLDSLSVIAVDRADLERAFSLAGNDFEDDLQIACAVDHRLDAIVTRDPKGFVHSPIPIHSPQFFLGFLDRTFPS